MPKTLKIAVFWAANASSDKSYYRQQPAPEIARGYMKKAREILTKHGFALDVQPPGSLDESRLINGQEITAWTAPIHTDFCMYAIRAFAGTSSIALTQRLPVIFCSFNHEILCLTKRPPGYIWAEEGICAWTISKELEAKSGAFYASPYRPFILVNTLMNPRNAMKRGVLAHEIAHAAGLRHSQDPANLMFEDADEQGDALSKDQKGQLAKAYFAA